MLNATSRVASTFSDMVLTAAASSMALSETAWRGVDVVQVLARKCEGHLSVDSETILEHWLSTPGARTLVPCLGPEVHAAALAASAAVAHGLPEIDAAVEDLQLTGNYSEIRMRASLSDTGHIQMAFSVINITFEVLWANPLWESLSMPKEAERAQILVQLYTVRAMIPVKKLDWAPRQLDSELPFRLRIRGKLTRMGRAWLRWWLMLGRFLGLDSLSGCGAVLLFVHTVYVIYCQVSKYFSFSTTFWKELIIARWQNRPRYISCRCCCLRRGHG